MKKFLPYLILILVLAGIAFLLWKKSQSPDALNNREGEFAVKDVKAVTHIVLTGSDKKEVTLTLANGTWNVNGKYTARKDLIEQLLATANSLSSLSPVPSAAHDNVMRSLMVQHVKAAFYTNNNSTPEKMYWVGGPTADGKATYMLLETAEGPASRPHQVIIPGYRGYVTPIYSTDEENWRSRILFQADDASIDKLSVDYSMSPELSFTIRRVAGADSFAVEPLQQKARINEPYQQKYVKQYLNFYNSIYIETFDNGNEAKDSILKTTPYCTIALTEKGRPANIIKIFYMPVNKRSKAQFDNNGKELTHDLDRFYASLNDGKDLAVVQYYVIGKLLRNYQDFYFKPGSKK